MPTLTMNLLCFYLATLTGVALASGDISLSLTELNVVREVGKTFVVSCSSPSEVTWYDPRDKPISHSVSDRIHQETLPPKGRVTLMLQNVLKEDKGNYTCKAKVDGKVVSASFTLTVIRPLSFVDTPKVQKAALYSTGVLRCDVMGDFQTSIAWIRNGETPKEPHFKKVNDGLTIMNTTLEDEGVYTCMAYQVSSYAANKLEINITLRVEYPPKWLETESPVVSYGLVGGYANLTCAVEAYPAATFKWLRGGRLLAPQARNVTTFHADNVGVLQLRVHNSTFGNYSCKAHNKLGEAERRILLQEGTKPDPPASVAVEASDGDSVSLDIDEAEVEDGELGTLGYRAQYRPMDVNLTWDEAPFLDWKKGVKPYRISGLVQNVEYEVRVATRNAAGYSDYSPVLSYKSPPAQAEHVSSPANVAADAAWLLLLARVALLRWL